MKQSIWLSKSTLNQAFQSVPEKFCTIIEKDDGSIACSKPVYCLELPLSLILISWFRVSAVNRISRLSITFQNVQKVLWFDELLSQLIIIIIMKRESYQSKFGILLQEADKLMIDGDRIKAFAKYKQAFTVFNYHQDELESYFEAKISMCEIQRDNGDYNGSRREFQNILKDINKKCDMEEYSAKKAKKQKFKIIHNLAKLQLAFSYNFKIDEDIENYKSYRCKMNDSFGYFSQAFSIVVDSLFKDTNIQSSWGSDYMRTKSNYLQLLYQEGEQFNNKEQIQEIFQEVKHAKNFYEAHKTKERQIDLYRCYYYKAVALKAVGKLDDCYKLLKIDYAFEKNNNQLADAEKSRNQLFVICLDLNNLKQAENYAKLPDKKEILKQVTKRREKIQKHFAMPQDALKKCTFQIYDQLFEDFNHEISIYHYDLARMDKQIDKIIQLYRNNSATKAILYYYSSQCNYRLKNYQKAEKMILQAMKISSSDQIQLRDWKIEKLKIMTMTSFNFEDLRDQNQKLLREVMTRLRNQRVQERRKQLQQQQNHLKANLNKIKKIQLKFKDNCHYSFSSPKEKQLLDKIENIKKGIKQNTISHISQYSLQNYSIHPQSQQNYNKKQQKLIFNPVQDYVNRCKQQNIFCRQQVKQNIQHNTPSRFFSEFINLNSQELILLISTINYSDLDLRNHIVDNKILSEILSRVPQFTLTSLKLNGINQIQPGKILELLMRIREVSQLHFVNFTAHKCSPFYELQKNKQVKQQTRPSSTPRSLTHALFLLPFTQSQFKAQNIRILKLKYCNLTDGHFKQLDLQLYSSIEQLNLSHNLLQGRQLASVMILPNLIKICLSGNPLKTLSFELWKTRFLDSNFALSVLKLKEVQFNIEISQQLTYILARVRLLNISRAKSVETLFKVLYDTLFEDKIIRLQAWIMKEVNFGNNHQLSQILSYVLRKIPLNMIDLRLCSYDKNFACFLKRIENEQGKIIKMGEGLEIINVDSFDLLA